MKSLKLFIILPFLLGVAITAGAQANYLSHVCPNTTTFTANSTYQANLNTLLSSLSSNATINNSGFYNISAGRDPDDVYGLFLCRGDSSSDFCQNCVTYATRDIVQRCPVEKVAIAWYDQCLLRYSNEFFFSTMSESPKAFFWNAQNISDQTRFNGILGNTMKDAAAEAANVRSGAKKFAVKQANFTALQTLYTLSECTPELSSSDCATCLQGAISDLPTCCDGKLGGRVLSPSCNIRYEVYPFYNHIATRPPPPPPSPSPVVLPSPSPGPVTRPQGKSGISAVTIVTIVVPISLSIVLFCMGLCFLRRRARKKYDSVQEDDGNEISTAESLQFDLSMIEAATNNFSDDNRLGEGGFGAVYKGTLPNGRQIAVKRLSTSSGQGAGEFKNEVVLLAKLQHRNLVRLIGFCLEGQEKILVYEFVPNKSLVYFLFDPEKQGQLDWERRYKIIGGIARGFLYLHEDSRLRIIHRDLKASNVLLDQDMNPKISDFGMARIFRVDQSEGNTNRVVGTYGYMSPEYAMHGQFSVKSDMYSFGVLVLEIISGKKNRSFYKTDGADDIVSYVWKHWRNGTPLEVLDPVLRDSNSRNEVLRCIQVGLLCVQEDPADRPTMATVVLMLNSYSVTLPVPQQPAFVANRRSGQSFTLKESTTKSALLSVDEESITEVYPR